ncbi:MAG TPA: hypothetical protein VGC41_15040, partial [Kofleriaceae bacterium]
MRMLIAIAATSCAAEMSLPDRVARGEVRGPVEVIGEPGANVLVAPMQRGRVWIAPGGSPIVFELVSNGHPIGVVAELSHGTVTAMRVYADSTQGHPISRTPFAGTAIATAHGTAAEAALVATANESWAGMNAHSAARTLASAAPEYTLEDFSAPTVLDRAGTEAMVDRFLGFVGEFQIVAMPVQFAAGDDVIT